MQMQVQVQRQKQSEALERLELFLKPLFWRSSKATAAAEVALPRRVVHNAVLQLTLPERLFFEDVSR